MSEQHKALVRRWLAEMDKRNWSAADELVAADYIDHSPPLPGTAPGREAVKQANAMLYAAFPDARHTIEDQIAEGDKVVTRLSTTGTFTGEVFGIPPNGKQVTMTGIMIHRIARRPARGALGRVRQVELPAADGSHPAALVIVALRQPRSSSAAASRRSGVSKPSVNQPRTSASSRPTSWSLPCARHGRPRLTAPRSSRLLAC